jgi:nondiscriminating aspartyl-tRNA synthetase
MERVLSDELASHVGERVRVAGWLHHRRELSKLTFLVLRDRRGLAQVVAEAPETLEQVAGLQPETVLELDALVVASEQAPGGVELHEPSLRILSAPTEAPPIELRRRELKEQLPTILDNAPVALRHPRQRAAFELAAATMAGYREALDALDFTEITSPKIVASATESGANVFRLDYFGRPAYLAQSPQFYKQIMVGVFERVYEIGPVFRAEPHETARHLAAYTSIDAEVGFVEDHTTVMGFAREAIAGMTEGVRTRAADAVERLGVELPDVPAEIPSIHFADAQALLEEGLGESLGGEPDLAPAHERWLTEWAGREHGSELLFVVGYPMAKRPFYTHPDPERPEFSRGFDLLFRGIEIITGGQRLHRYEDYVAALAARGEGVEAYEGYLQAFKHGMPPHGGFAIGLERWVARLVGAQNIREATLFPRDRNRLSP